MMTGNNTITLNVATMQKAVQMYLDSLFRDGFAPTVTLIKAKSLDGLCTSFDVEVSDPPDAKIASGT